VSGAGSASMRARNDAIYDVSEEIDLSTIVPLIALPSSPGNVVPVREVAGRPVEQVVIGSSANPRIRDCPTSQSSPQS
jgi:aconitate hydratase